MIDVFLYSVVILVLYKLTYNLLCVYSTVSFH